jgi:hypothetical protein
VIPERIEELQGIVEMQASTIVGLEGHNQVDAQKREADQTRIADLEKRLAARDQEAKYYYGCLAFIRNSLLMYSHSELLTNFKNAFALSDKALHSSESDRVAYREVTFTAFCAKPTNPIS